MEIIRTRNNYLFMPSKFKLSADPHSPSSRFLDLNFRGRGTCPEKQEEKTLPGVHPQEGSLGASGDPFLPLRCKLVTLPLGCNLLLSPASW